MSSYDDWKLRSPDDERCGYLCIGCENILPVPHMTCDECAEIIAAEDALLEFYCWEPWP